MKKASDFTFPPPTTPFSQFRPSEQDVYFAQRMQNMQRIAEVIRHDSRIPEEAQPGLLKYILDPNGLVTVAAGTTGGAIGKVIGSFLSLNKSEQTLLSLAGFGIGSIIYGQMQKDQSHLATNNYGTDRHTIHSSQPR